MSPPKEQVFLTFNLGGVDQYSSASADIRLTTVKITTLAVPTQPKQDRITIQIKLRKLIVRDHSTRGSLKH